ncbi:general substrate transporter [Aspergillus germanicus]
MPSFYAFLSVLAASLAALSLGLDVGMISSTLVQPTFISYFDNPSSAQTGGIVAAFSAGATFGAYACSWVGDPHGRIWALRVGAVIAVIGCALQAGAVHVAMLIIGRLVNGFGAGQLTAVFPVYASEVSPPKIRGAFGGLQMLMIEAAIFVATATGYAFGVHYDNDAQWRGPLAVQAIPLVLLIPISFFIPESPRWLIMKGRETEALEILARLHGGGDTSDEYVQMEFNGIQLHVTAEQQAFKPTWKEIALRPSWRRRVLLAAALQTFAQATGINCVQYYAATIYTKLGFNTDQSLLINLLYGAFGLLSALVWVVSLDRFSRVKLLIVTTLFMAAALLVQSVLSAVYTKESDPNPNALRAQVAMFFVFQLGFVAVGMLGWLIPPEMSPLAIRAKVNSVSVSVNNIAGLVVAEVSPIALDAIGFKFFYVYVACDIVASVFYYFCLPDTNGLTLEEMDVKFGDQVVDLSVSAKGDVFHQENVAV